MVEIYSMTQGHCYWNETLWERVFAACVDGKLDFVH